MGSGSFSVNRLPNWIVIRRLGQPCRRYRFGCSSRFPNWIVIRRLGQPCRRYRFGCSSNELCIVSRRSAKVGDYTNVGYPEAWKALPCHRVLWYGYRLVGLKFGVYLCVGGGWGYIIRLPDFCREIFCFSCFDRDWFGYRNTEWNAPITYQGTLVCSIGVVVGNKTRNSSVLQHFYNNIEWYYNRIRNAGSFLRRSMPYLCILFIYFSILFFIILCTLLAALFCRFETGTGHRARLQSADERISRWTICSAPRSWIASGPPFWVSLLICAASGTRDIRLQGAAPGGSYLQGPAESVIEGGVAEDKCWLGGGLRCGWRLGYQNFVSHAKRQANACVCSKFRSD